MAASSSARIQATVAACWRRCRCRPRSGARHTRPLVSEPGVHWSSPRWSPDGALDRGRTRVARRPIRDRARRSVSGRIVRTVVSSHGSRSVSPAWSADGRLLFSSDRDGDGLPHLRHRPGTRQTSRLEDAGPNAASPEPSRDGRTLAFVGYTPDGYDLFSLSLESARWTVVASDTSARPLSWRRRSCRRPRRRPATRPGARSRRVLDADARVRRRRGRGRRRHGRNRCARTSCLRHRGGLVDRAGAAGLVGGLRLRPLVAHALRERRRRHRPLARRRGAHARGQRRRAVPRPARALVAVAARGAAFVGRRVPLRRLGRRTAGPLRIWRHRAHRPPRAPRWLAARTTRDPTATPSAARTAGPRP